MASGRGGARSATGVGELLTGPERFDLLHAGRRRRRAAAGRGRRLRRLLLLAPPRHEPRAGSSARTPSRCCRTGGTCRSATTAGPARSWSAAPTSCGRPGSCPTRRRRAAPRRRPGRSTSSSRSASSSAARRRRADRRRRRRPRTSSASCCSTTGRPATSRPSSTSRSGRTSARASPRRSRRGSSRSTRCARSSSSRPTQDPPPDPYLRAAAPWGLDLHLDGRAQRHRRSRATNFVDDVLDLRPAARPPHRQRRERRGPATCSRRAPCQRPDAGRAGQPDRADVARRRAARRWPTAARARSSTTATR